MDERPDDERALDPDTPPEPTPPEVPAHPRRWPSVAEEIRAAAQDAEREPDRSG